MKTHCTLFFLFLFLFFGQIFAQTDPIEITFSTPDPLCMTDTSGCTAALNYVFTLIAENPGGLTLSHQLQTEGGVASADSFGELTGSYPDYQIEGDYPAGSHQFLLEIQDGEGNMINVELPFSIVDCQPPIPVCIIGLAIEFTPGLPEYDDNGHYIIDILHVEDFIATLAMDCSMPVIYSINASWQPPNMFQDTLIVTCEEFPETSIIEIYAWDAENNPYAVQPDGTIGGPNYTFCQTYVLIQDYAFNLCEPNPPSANIFGTIQTESGVPVGNVDVILSGGQDLNQVTNIIGEYSFSQLFVGDDYTIIPQLNTHPKNGLSTLDILQVYKHILGVAPLDSPYKMIAADINNSHTITGFDIIHLRRLVLNIDDELTNNTSWRFIDAAYQFPNPLNPWAQDFPEVISINNLSNGDEESKNFIAIKIGDLNGSASTN